MAEVKVEAFPFLDVKVFVEVKGQLMEWADLRHKLLSNTPVFSRSGERLGPDDLGGGSRSGAALAAMRGC